MSDAVSRPLGRWRRGSVAPTPDGRIELRIGRHRFDLLTVRIDHRDCRRRITLDIKDPEGKRYTAHYRRRWPSILGFIIAALLFDDEEPFNWEDRDLGLFAFNVAHNNGPGKYRHRFQNANGPKENWTIDRTISDGVLAIDSRVVGQLPVQRNIVIDDLTDISVKFDISGIYLDLAVLVFRTAKSVATVPVPASPPKSTPQDWPGKRFGFWHDLTETLRQLPGWDAAAEAAIQDARGYERDREPATFIGMRNRSERPVWSRPE